MQALTLTVGLALAACSPAGGTATAVTLPAPRAEASTEDSAVPTASPIQPPAPEDLTRVDTRGAVVFAVTPLNLASPDETLDFEVSMNTHSVALSWNLAAQSVLVTDTGLAVGALSWPVGGGHHYLGTLSFPSRTGDGTSVLDGAKTLTLTIRNTDVPERVFSWDLPN